MKARTRRFAIALVAALALALGVQASFNRSERAEASQAVRAYHVGAGPLLGELVESSAPGGVWRAESESGWRGIVHVAYRAPGGAYSFDYDVPARGIRPADPVSAALLARLPQAPILSTP